MARENSCIGIVQIGLPDCQRESKKESRRRGHVVISKWEASILNTAARRDKKVDLCHRKRRKGSGLKWYLKITVNWPLHITCLWKNQLSLRSNQSEHRNHRWFCEMQDDCTLPLHFISAGLSLLASHYFELLQFSLARKHWFWNIHISNLRNLYREWKLCIWKYW